MSDMDSRRPARSLQRRALGAVLGRAARRIYRIIGAPDYGAYLEHMRRCHPDRTPLAQAEFFRQRLHDRYDRVGTRCC